MDQPQPSPPPPGPPAPPWAGGRQRRRRLISREAIVQETLAIIDAEGCEAVTMRRVAARLGVAASSLYQHVATREELLQAAVHQVLDDSSGAMPDTGDWAADLRTFFVGLHERLQAHADLVAHAFADTTAPNGSDDLRDVEVLLERLAAAGLEARDAVRCFDRLMLYTVADVYETWRFTQKMGQKGQREWLEAMRGYLAGIPAEEYPQLAAHHELLLDQGDPGEGFLFGLDLLLDGMAVRAARG